MATLEPRLPRRALLGAGVATTLAAGAAAAAPSAPDRTSATPPQDWAALAHYRDANPIDAARPAAARRVVFLGDSITQAWRDQRPEFFAAHGFIGRGISGQTTPQMLVRFWADVVALKPAAVHILAGTNDVAENTGPYDLTAVTRNFMAMAAIARANRIRVVVGATPPAADFSWRHGLNPIPKIAGLNAWLRAWARREGFAFADYTAVLDDGAGAIRPGLASDGVHPTQAGYAAMEPVALAAAARALGARRRRG